MEVLQIECIIPNLIIIGIYVFFLTSSGLTGKGGKNVVIIHTGNRREEVKLLDSWKSFRHFVAKRFEGRVAVPALAVQTLRKSCCNSGTCCPNSSKVVLQFRHLPSKLLEGRVAVPANGIQTLRRMNIIPAGTFQTLRRTNIIPAGTFQTLKRMNIIPARIEKLLESRVAVQASGIQTLGRSNIIPEPIVQTLRRSSCSSWCCCPNSWKVVM